MDTINALYDLFLQYRTISTDSRNVPSGSLFFALKGEHFDGNRYAAEAIKKGAAWAIVDDPGLKNGDRFFYVQDVLIALQELAMMHRARIKATVIGITGSNGKTTTKELILAVVSQKDSCHATTGNLNNHIGVPLTLLSLNDTHEFAIVEMGANHPGEIADLSRIANPDFGLITNVGKAHLEGFGGFGGVVKAKTELYRHLEGNGGIAFVNSGNAILTEAARELETVCYGTMECEVSGELIQSNPSLVVKVRIGSKSMELATNLVGSYNLENILAAVCIGHYFNVEVEDIKSAIEGYIPQNNRSQVLQTPKNTLIMDAYNANPSSMEAAIVNFAEGNYYNTALFLGEMLELGMESETEHARVVELVKELDFKKVYLVGKSFKLDNTKGMKSFGSTEELMDNLKKYPVAGFTILIKGSRGNRLEDIIKFL